MYKLILTLFLLIAQQSIQAQVTLYQTPEGKLLTQHQLDSIRLDLEKKMTTLKMKVQLNTSPLSTRKDTTFLSFNLKAIPASQAIAESKKDPWIGKKLPPFTLLNLEGQELTEAIGHGKVMLINTWFTSCAPCIAEMPELNRIQAQYQNQDIVFVAMAPEKADRIQLFLQKHPYTFTHLQVAQSYIESNFGTTYPKSILVGKDGTIQFIEGALVSLDGNDPAVMQLQEKKYVIHSQKLTEAIKRELAK